MDKDHSLEGEYLTVGELMAFIRRHNLPDGAKIFYERIEDVYFKKPGWKPKK